MRLEVFLESEVGGAILLMTSFRLVQKIGEGSYSRVYKAMSEQSQRTLAVKVISFKDAPADYIQERQLQILRGCAHPNIAPLLDFIKTDNSYYLVFEYFPMNLAQYYQFYRGLSQRRLPQRQVEKIMAQVSAGLAYLHGKGVMHRDIKPENVMVDPSTLTVKLIDFGFAKHTKLQPHTDYMVTRWYRPLEVVLGCNYDERVDVFGAAAVYLELLEGQEAFQSESNMDQLHVLLRVCGHPSPGTVTHRALEKMGIMECGGEAQWPESLDKIDSSLKDILKSMLSSAPQERPSISKLLEYLQSSPEERRQRANSSSKRRSRSAANGLSLVSMRAKSKGRVVRGRVSGVVEAKKLLGKLEEEEPTESELTGATQFMG